ncbi:MAG: phosphoserine phosphatase SerB [Actinomycetota bacterium]
MKYKLILSDVDSTLIQEEVIDLLAAESGHAIEVSSITAKVMAGELDFREALLARVELLEGLPESVFEKVASQITLSPGALELRTFCRENQIKFGAVTGGFHQVLERVSFFGELDYLEANSLDVANGYLTGMLNEPIIDREAKARHLKLFAESYGINLAEPIAIGDGANDLLMIEQSGFGVAYKAKPILRKVAALSIEENLAELIATLKSS